MVAPASATDSTRRAPWTHPTGRVRLFDAARGFSVVSMVLFHACYDAAFIYGLPLPFFSGALVAVWRATIAWTFLAVSGWMCSFSRNNLARAGRYLAVAALIFVATTLAAVDDPISFGIVFCIGAATLVDALLERIHREPQGVILAAALVAVFLLCLNVPRGSLGGPFFSLAIPEACYSTPWFAWLGFPGPGFVSGDYYPLVPFALMYGAGIAIGRWFKRVGYPGWMLRAHCRPLEWVGRHALPVYVVHQPALIALFGLLGA